MPTLRTISTPGVSLSTMNIDIRRWRSSSGSVTASTTRNAGEVGVRREPLLAVDHPLVAVALGAGHEPGRVGTTARLGHRVRRHDLLCEQRLEVALLQVVGAVVGQDLGVARVGRLTAEDDRSAVRASEDLVEQRQLDLAVAGAAEVRTEVARPQAPLAHLLLERWDQRLTHRILHVPCVVDDLIDGLDLVADEVVDPVELCLELGIGFEIPTHGGTPFSTVRRLHESRTRTACQEFIMINTSAGCQRHSISWSTTSPFDRRL